LKRPTLRLVFFLTIVGLASLLLFLFWVLNSTSKKTLLETSDAVREERTERVAAQVMAEVDKRTRSLKSLDGLLRAGAVSPDDARSVEAVLFAEVAVEPDVSEATFTRAALVAATAEGVEVDPRNRWQVTVYRAVQGQAEAHIVTRYTHLEKGRLVVEIRDRPPQGAFGSAPLVRQPAGEVEDPTRHPTFQAAALIEAPERILASDLHWFEPDMPLPAKERRVIVSGQKPVRDAAGRFLGVMRVGLLTRRLNELVRRPTPDDPQWVFFCDTDGRLLTAIGPGDAVVEQGDDLRVVPASMPAELAVAVRRPELKAVETHKAGAQKAAFEVEGRRYLATYQYLPNSLDWVVAIVAPESAYLHGLDQQQMSMLKVSLAIMAIILVVGVITLRFVRRGLVAIEASTARMQNFDFSPAPVRQPIRDLQDVGERLELAKTAMRAMGRYVPVALVRLLFKTGREPVLGGELHDV
jgi:adenylate cyclase